MSIRASTTAQRLNDRVTFERCTRDENGDISAWSTIVRDVCAAVDGAKAYGSEPVVVDGIRSLSGYTVWVRSDILDRFGIAVDDRIVWKGAPFDIKDIPQQGLHGRLIALYCEAGKNKG